MADFSQAHAPVAVWEGGYANHPNDRGNLMRHRPQVPSRSGAVEAG